MLPEDDLRIETCRRVLNVLKVRSLLAPGATILNFIILLKSPFVGVYD
jgi:hypothetical protein